MALTDNILAYWKLDNDGSGNVSLLDSTGNGYPLTNNNNIPLGTGIIAGDAVANGSGWLNTSTPFNFSGDFSVGFWLNNASSANQAFCGTSNIGFNTNISSTEFVIGKTGIDITVGNSSLSIDNNFHYFAITRSSGLVRLYLDGTEVASGTDPRDFSTTYGLFADPTGAYSGGNGYGIDEVGIWSRALSPTEVYNLYNNGYGRTYPFTLDAGCIAYWNLNDDGSGNVSLVDSTGNGNTLTNSGAVTLGTGIIAGDAVFDGSDYLSGNDTILSGASEFSIGFWINGNITGRQNILGAYSVSNKGPLVYINSSNFGNNIIFLPNGSDQIITSGVDFYGWNYVVCTFSASNNSFNVYVNGLQNVSGSVTQAVPSYSTYFGLGNTEQNFPFTGQLDEVGIWNRPLSPLEVYNLYYNGTGNTYPFTKTPITPPTSFPTDGCISYWNLNDDGSGNVSLVDNTGNGNTLTNNGGVTLGTGIIDGGAVCNGSNYLSSSISCGSSFSISNWFYCTSIANDYESPFSTGAISGEALNLNGPISGYDSNWSIYIGSDSTRLDWSTQPNLNEWNNVVLVVENGKIKLYLNGSIVVSYSTSADQSFSGLFIGYTSYFIGNLDEIGIWNRALSYWEIQALYNNGYGITYPSGPSNIHLYYNNAQEDGDWGNLLNWWTDSGFTIQATQLPTSTNPISLYGAVSQNTQGADQCFCYHATFWSSDFGAGLTLQASGTVNMQGTSILAGTTTDGVSMHDSSQIASTGVVGGDVVMRDSSRNYGSITGNATVYYDSGNGQYPIGGTVSGSVTYTGWPAASTQYFNDDVTGSGATGNWQDLNNWWADDTFTTRPLNPPVGGIQLLPDAGTTIYVYGSGLSAYNDNSTIAVNQAFFHSTAYLNTPIVLNVSIDARFYDSSGFQSYIYGNCYLFNSSYFYGNGGSGFSTGNVYLQDNSGIYQSSSDISSLSNGAIYVNSLQALENSFSYKFDGVSDGVSYNIPSGGGGGMISRLLNLPWFIKL